MADSTDDAQLVRLARAGSHEAFARLYDRYARLVRALCYDAALDLNTAQDLCQEVFMRAYRKIDTLEKPQSFGAWLVAITRNVGREHRKKMARDRHQWQAELEAVSPVENAAESRGLEQRELFAAVARLPEDERLAIHLFYLDEQPAEAARAVMDLSRSGFYKVLNRAKSELKKALTPEQEATP